jgi:hypothetical protein
MLHAVSSDELSSNRRKRIALRNIREHNDKTVAILRQGGW